MTSRVTWTSYPLKATWGFSMGKFSHLTPPNARNWIKEGYGIEDIAVRTHHRRDYVKAMLIKWELWPDAYNPTLPS